MNTKHKTVRDIVHEQHTKPTRWDADTKHTDSVEALKERAEYLGSPYAESMSDQERLVALIHMAQSVPQVLTTLQANQSQQVEEGELAQHLKANFCDGDQDNTAIRFTYEGALDIAEYFFRLGKSQQVEEAVLAADATGAYHSGYLAGRAEVEEAVTEIKDRAYKFVAGYKEKYAGCGMADSMLALDELLQALTPNHQD